MKYLVTYDLVGTDETSADYQRLIERIKAYGTYGKAQKSVWLIRSSATATEVRDNLVQDMDADDRLLVVRVESGAAWRNLICNNQWMLDFMKK